MITTTELRELAEHRGAPLVATVYLDVDGRRRPVVTQCAEAFEVLADQLRRAATAAPADDLERRTRAIEGDVERMRAWLGSALDRDDAGGVSRDGSTRGVAMFSCHEQDWFRVEVLERPVNDEVAVGPVPRLGQLLAHARVPDVLLVALVDRRRLRLVEVRGEHVVEVATLDEPVPRAIDSATETGRQERWLDELARTHYRHAAKVLEQAVAERPGVDLSLAGPDEAVAALSAQLDNGAQARVVDRVHLAVTSPDDDVLVAARRLLDELADRREREAVDELRRRAGADDRGVVGLQATLAAVADKRVARLLVDADLHAPGSECPACGHLDVPVDRCARCGTVTLAIDDVVDVAIDRSVTQHATVEPCRTGALDDLGGIGALERF